MGVASEVEIEVTAVGFEALSGELVIRSGSQRTAAKERRKETRNKTIVPTIHTLASVIIGCGDIVRPECSACGRGRECIRAPLHKMS